MSKKEPLTLWQSAVRATCADNAVAAAPLVISEEAKKEIAEAFNRNVSDELLKAFRTPVDSETLAKAVC